MNLSYRNTVLAAVAGILLAAPAAALAAPPTPPPCTITGTNSNDKLKGTPGDDVICGMEGRDIINGRGGDDVILGGNGRDRLVGGPGADVIDGGNGSDDTVHEHSGPAGMKIDLVAGVNQDAYGFTDTILQIERVEGTSYGDEIVGNGFNNILKGRGGPDKIEGGDGADTLVGGRGADQLLGQAGFDVLMPGPDDDDVVGGPGSDRLQYTDLSGGVAVLLTAFSSDLGGGHEPVTAITGNGGTDTVGGIENVTGTRFLDFLGVLNPAVRSALDGFGGNDTFITNDGAAGDSIKGTAGADCSNSDLADRRVGC